MRNGVNEIYLTKSIKERLDLRLLIGITKLLKNKILNCKEEDLDYLQIFEVKNNRLIHRQEEPEKSEEYILNGKFNNAKVLAVQGMDREIGKYWTIMFPEDY